MAVLNKIRSRGIFLIIVIALALFSFILADVIQNGGFSSEKDQNSIGSINGKNVSRIDFSNRLQNIQQNSMGNLTTIQAVNQTWDAMLEQALIEEQVKKLGIDVGNRQINAALEQQFGSNPEFSRDGQFDINQFKAYIDQLKYDAPEAYQEWLMTEGQIIDNAKNNVYFDMIQAGAGITEKEAEEIYKMNNTNFDLQYVRIPYSDIKDDEINVSDAEIKDYIKKHKNKFKTDGTRDVRYVLFEEKATSEDEEAAKKELTELIDDHKSYNKAADVEETVKGFKNTDNYEEFLNENSDLSFEDRFIFKNNLPADYADTLINLDKGAVFGPYKDDGYWKYSKAVDHKEIPDSVKVHHILITHGEMAQSQEVDRSEAEAKQLADSLLSAIDKDTDKFAEVAAKYSEDPSSQAEKGEIGWITYPEQGADDPLVSYVFKNDKGSYGIVESEYGYHIVYLEDVRNKQQTVKLATLAKTIEASEKTSGELYNQSSKFQKEAANGDFKEAAESNNYDVKITKGLGSLDEEITGIGNQRSIVQWAFEDDTKTGDIKRFDLDEGYLVVQVTASSSKGTKGVDAVRAEVEPILMKEKKANHVKNNISNTDLDDIASNYGTQVRTKQDANLEDGDLEGEEPKVIAHAFALNEGDSSDPIAGNDAIYIIQLSNKTDAEEIGSYNGIIHQENEKAKMETSEKVMEALKNKADIEDRRAEFY